MSLQTLCKFDVLEVVETVDGIPQRFVILLLDQQVVICFIDGLDVELQSIQLS